jgi:hypothetical protein
MSSVREPPSRRATFLVGLAAVAVGLYLLLMGLGVLPKPARGASGALWVAAVAGIAFMFAGISIAFGAIQGVSASGELPKDAGWWSRLLYYVLGLVACASLAVIGSWVAFGPGLRHFGGTGMFLLSPDANNLVGRIVFGIGAALTWLCTIAMAVSGARKLFARSQN